MHRQALVPDRRSSPRRPAELAGLLRLERGVFIPCFIRDISPMGVGLELVFEAFVPLQFKLQIPADLFEADCQLRHRKGVLLGAEFISARAEALARYG